MNLSDLNPNQLEAVKATGGPILIFAGAGSGKTRVLTHKIAYLIEEIGLPPENILAVTFTNKAAQEMSERVTSLVQINTSKMSIGTFHSICAGILRQNIHHLGYTNSFTIYDSSDSKTLVKNIIKDMNLDPKQFDASSYQYMISSKKNMLMSPQDVAESAEGYIDEKLADIYINYQSELEKNNALDFDDLLILPIKLFNEHPNILDYYRQKYKYILVDEYQDTNKPQFQFINLLSEVHRDIFVVGDDDQSIYGWRGADVRNILDFSEQYPDSKVIKLEQNYRSTGNILDAAYSVVSKNESRADKKLWTENAKGSKIKLVECFDDRHEANKVLEMIFDSSFPKSEIVVLYRTNAQSRVIEDALRKNAVPYQIIGGVKFYERKEIKDALAYLRIVTNPDDGLSFNRVVNFPPRGIGKTSIDKINDYLNKNNLGYLDLNIEDLSIGPKQKKELGDFLSFIKKLNGNKDRPAIEILLDIINEIDLKNYYLNQPNVESHERWKNVEELITSIEEYSEQNKDKNLSDFLEEVSLLTDIDRHNTDYESITLMTIHSAKGLEYSLVFIVGLEEGLFPITSYSSLENDIDEERRLFYVGSTRAMKQLVLSYAKKRMKYGYEMILSSKSRFLDEIPLELLDIDGGNANIFASDRMVSNNSPQKKNLNINYQTSSSIKVGDNVHHKVFGNGRVVQISGFGDTQQISIRFVGNVTKKLMKKYANLSKID
jgi:DNA helicase-2/ATP-dependent DNA helicase PcrA